MCYVKARPVPAAAPAPRSAKLAKPINSNLTPPSPRPLQPFPMELMSFVPDQQRRQQQQQQFEQMDPLTLFADDPERLPFADLASISFGSLDGAEWFDEGCDSVFAQTASSSPIPASTSAASAATAVGNGSSSSSAFSSPASGLAPLATSAQTSTAALDDASSSSSVTLLPWLDSLAASTLTALGCSNVRFPQAADPESPLAPAAAAWVKPDPEVVPVQSYLPSPRHQGFPSPPPLLAATLKTPPAPGHHGSPPKRAASGSGDELSQEVMIKRAKNTEAARRSRARKNARLETLEVEVGQLEQDKATLLVRLAVMETERASSALREADLSRRIAHLEDQLAESHRAMVMGLGISPPSL
ncbi:hypothetical protein HK405_005527 [Cladochytrium tenue]|nr:hypothetical protein HK405_005527 [Cladochytrium tenue]